MNESKIELTGRLRREGRWAEASKRKDEKVKEFRAGGDSLRVAAEKAWEWLAAEYPPVEVRPLADIVASDCELVSGPEATALEVDDAAEENDGDCPALPGVATWESLQWVAEALGRIARGQKVKLSEAPSDAAIGILDWARFDRERFYELWASANRRHDPGPAEKKPAKRFTPEDIDAMLDECLAEAEEIEREATEKAEAWADPFG